MVNTLEEKKGENIILIDITEHCSFTDYFVICSAISERTMKALANDIQKEVKTAYSLNAWGVEGKPDDGWMLIDFGEVVVHLFSAEQRDYYRLEELWQEGTVLLHIR
ncbi:MAG: ribosome silencing factor [Anaerolineales bacterium]|nr:ribosome silencing factor [Anaerolineales bacterium]